jgi:hypothetical protein
MKAPVSWLTEFVTCDIPLEAIADRLNNAGLEVEAIENVGAFDARVLVGSLLETRQLADAGGAVVAVVDVGERLECVSTAPNLKRMQPGSRIAVATGGSTLIEPVKDEFRTFSVAAVTFHGVESQAVLRSAMELGSAMTTANCWSWRRRRVLVFRSSRRSVPRRTGMPIKSSF